VKEVALAKVKDDFSKYLRLAVEREVVITRHGRPAGVLIGFASEDDWFDYRLEHHPEFLRRIEEARSALRQGRGIALEDAFNRLLQPTSGTDCANIQLGPVAEGERGPFPRDRGARSLSMAAVASVLRRTALAFSLTLKRIDPRLWTA
jgi:prevent-host-death family protein